LHFKEQNWSLALPLSSFGRAPDSLSDGQGLEPNQKLQTLSVMLNTGQSAKSGSFDPHC